MQMITILIIKYVFYAAVLIQIVLAVVLLLQQAYLNVNNAIQAQSIFLEKLT